MNGASGASGRQRGPASQVEPVGARDETVERHHHLENDSSIGHAHKDLLGDTNSLETDCGDGGGLYIGAPAEDAARGEPVTRDPDERLREVEDQGLSEVVARALRNYLAGDGDQLAADLAAGARIELPTLPVTVGAVDSVKWSPGGSAVIAVVDAKDHVGVQWKLRYEVAVTQVAGRWQITAIETRDG